jgi:hypothetical protein
MDDTLLYNSVYSAIRRALYPTGLPPIADARTSRAAREVFSIVHRAIDGEREHEVLRQRDEMIHGRGEASNVNQAQ